MTNPVVHAIAFITALLVPGGLLIYFAWRAARSISVKAEPNQTGQKHRSDEEAANKPTPDEALEAFLDMYPKYSQDSLRARSRADRLQLHKTRPKKKSQ